MKELLKQEFLKYNPNFTDDEIKMGLELFELKDFKAKDIILKSGEVFNYLVFAESSVTRCFYYDEKQNEQTLWMKPKQMFLTEYKSFRNQEKSMFSLQFYEDTSALLINRENLVQLYSKSNNWAIFGINLIESNHVTLIDTFVNLLSNDATRNYEYIAYMFPRFLQVAPLKDIASMLQVSQVTLSRIRAGTQTKG